MMEIDPEIEIIRIVRSDRENRGKTHRGKFYSEVKNYWNSATAQQTGES